MEYDASWDSQRLTCMHGVREGLDSHDCPSCATIARSTGLDMSDGKTYLYRSAPRAPKAEALHGATS